MTADNRQLSDEVAAARLTSKDNILIESMTRNGKLNVKGKRVRKIFASLSVQSEMKSPTFKAVVRLARAGHCQPEPDLTNTKRRQFVSQLYCSNNGWKQLNKVSGG